MITEDEAIIEYYGPDFARIGVEGKWVEFIRREPGMTKKDLLELINEMNRTKTQ
jgi:hypothetical protein